MRDDIRRNDAFSELALPLLGSLYNFANWLTRDATEAEDLVQETLTRALRAFPNFQIGTNFRAWIYSILRNAWINSRSALAARMTVPLDDDLPEPADGRTPESMLLDTISHAKLKSAIRALPAMYRQVLVLCDVEGMSYAEIAQALEIPMGTVMSRLSRARRLVRDAVQSGKQAAQRLGS